MPNLVVISIFVTAAEKGEKSEKGGTGEKVMEEKEKSEEAPVPAESAEKKEKADGQAPDVKNGEFWRALSLIIIISNLSVIKPSFILLSVHFFWLQMKAR